jgi:hypothetical protein
MARYSSNVSLGGTQQAMSASYKTLVALTAATATLTNAKVYDILVGTSGLPADNYLEFDMSRQTAAGTSTAITPVSLDGAHRAAGTVGSANFSAEGTITAASSLFYVGVNQRASYRWVAAPGSEFIIPATNLAGVALRARSGAYTGFSTGQLLHEE